MSERRAVYRASISSLGSGFGYGHGLLEDFLNRNDARADLRREKSLSQAPVLLSYCPARHSLPETLTIPPFLGKCIDRRHE